MLLAQGCFSNTKDYACGMPVISVLPLAPSSSQREVSNWKRGATAHSISTPGPMTTGGPSMQAVFPVLRHRVVVLAMDDIRTHMQGVTAVGRQLAPSPI
jgi:hypothetical protein